VVSPFQAILDYEIANKIPPGWVNFSISRTSPNGSWHKLERGEIKMDAEFFSAFSQDLQNQALWKAFHERMRTKQKSPAILESLPPVPQVDGELLFWEMMRVSRTPDPYMFPALKKLKASGEFVIGALSNTIIFPDGHPYNEVSEVKAQFDFFISSAHVGLRKPDPRIYELALQTAAAVSASRGVTDLHPSDVLFLDDIGENLKAAKKAGLGTLKVNLGRTQDAVKELERITGIPLLDNEDRPKL
jgi:HAD superfamily hydrolase (TIGR01509 family)